MNLLEIDIGNSRAKWRISGSSGAGNLASQALLEPFAYPAEWRNIRSIRMASVRSDRETEACIAALSKHFACEIHRAYSVQDAAGVINGYAEPKRLGVDRWLALLAARQRVLGDVVVVDAGTAITLDLMTHQGVHLGGYILPGVARQAESLWGGTGRVQVATSHLQPLFVPGRGTEDAVSAAITAAIAGLCQSASRQLPGAHWCLTGGDLRWLELICAELGFGVSSCPDLVLDGLAWCPTQIYPAP